MKIIQTLRPTRTNFAPVSGTVNTHAKIFCLESAAEREKLRGTEDKGGTMVREMQLLTMGFILAFLGAIVIGVF